jgi:hypothetical protein
MLPFAVCEYLTSGSLVNLPHKITRFISFPPYFPFTAKNKFAINTTNKIILNAMLIPNIQAIHDITKLSTKEIPNSMSTNNKINKI